MFIDDHAHVLMNSMAMGKTLAEAVDAANLTCQPGIPGTPNHTPMTYAGDGFTRIQNVYLTQSERNTLSRGDIDKWYYILP